jgi:hypothetical protein
MKQMIATIYDTQRIQQQGRQIKVGQETAIVKSKHSKSKGKTPEQKERDRLRKIEYRKENREKIRSYNVAKHAATKPLIQARRLEKRTAREKELQIAQSLTAHIKAYEKSSVADARLHCSKKIYPDWSYFWVKEQAKRHSKQRYHNFTSEQKKEYNRKCMENSKKNSKTMEKRRHAIKEWKKINKSKMSEYIAKSIKKRKQVDRGFKIQCNMRSRFRDIIKIAKEGISKWNSTLIGCNTVELAKHLESQFEPWMNWDNYGTLWHVDHILPCSLFDHNNPAHVKQCWHYTNLRPLCAKKNIAKSNKIENPQLALLL